MTDLIKHIGQVAEFEFQDADSLEAVPLDELAIWINTGHSAIKFAVRRLAVHVAQVGAFLVVAKSKVKHGEWLDWLAENCSEITVRTAQRYIGMYEKLSVHPNTTLVSYLTPLQAYKALGIVRDANDITEIVQLPPPEAGKYRTIVVDPPWEMQKIERIEASNQHGFDYATMGIDEIRDFVVIPSSADSLCHLYLWTTQKNLNDSFAILDHWGFNHIFTMTWRKNGGFQPFGLPQYNAEFVVFGRKGGLGFLDTKDFFVCFDGKRREHGRKPDEFYDTVRRVSPEPRLDFFSREEREGFDTWGAEKGKFNERDI